MSRSLFGAVAGLFWVSLSGCGTLVSFEKGGLDNPKIYGGVQFDAEMVRTISDDDRYVKLLNMVYAVDMPFSLVADTLTLPITVTTTLVNTTKVEKK